MSGAPGDATCSTYLLQAQCPAGFSGELRCGRPITDFIGTGDDAYTTVRHSYGNANALRMYAVESGRSMLRHLSKFRSCRAQHG